MNDWRDDFMDYLSYQVKEEVVTNYLRERMILEEEVKEYQGELAAYRELEDEVRRRRDELANLLTCPENYQGFWRKLGFDAPPLRHLDHGPGLDWSPACPLEITPRGWTRKGKYVDLTLKAYGALFKRVEAAREAAGELWALADEINRDIDKFHGNYDILNIIRFLKSTNVMERERSKLLGENFTYEETSSLEQKMRFSRLKPAEDGVAAWPELPPPPAARRRTESYLAELFKEERGAIMPALDQRKTVS